MKSARQKKKKKPQSGSARDKIQISLCMIVRDEEEYLGKCLRSVKALVDEIIVVDTGSVDRTVEIAKSFGAKVIDFEWQDDFSKARNVGLDQAKGDWILFLDADEELETRGRQLIRRALKANKSFNRFLLTIASFEEENTRISPTFYSPSVRLFKNRPEYRFRFAVHEELVVKNGNLGTINAKIWHYGYLGSVSKKRQKLQRNAALVENSSWEDIDYGLFLAAREEYQRGNFESALGKNRQAYEGLKETNKLLVERLFLNLIKCCYQLDLFEELNDWVEKGLARWPDYTDLEHWRALSYLKQENYTCALESFNACLVLGEPPAHHASRSGVGGWRALAGSGLCLANLRQLDKAVSDWVQALKISPLAYRVLERLVPLLSYLGHDEKSIRQELEPHVDLKAPEIRQVYEESLRSIRGVPQS